MSYLVQHGLAKTWIFVVGAVMLAGTFSNRVVAQNSWTWGAVGGGNGDMGNPLNWQPNGVPDFGAVNGLDSLTFSTSSNTTVSMTDDSAGDQVQDITFDASAPAYSFTTFPDHTDNNFTIRGTLLNQSLNTQYFPGTTDLYISSGGALNAASGNQSTHLSLDLGGGFIHGSITMTGSYDVTTPGLTSTGGTQTLTMLGSGTLFITGDSLSTGGIGGTGNLAIGSNSASAAGPIGAVRISNDNALGVGSSTSSHFTIIYGKTNSNGRLELTGGINSPEGIRLEGRASNATALSTFGYNNSLAPAIVNVSNDNTLSGPILLFDNGSSKNNGAFNFASNSGLLTVTGNLAFNLSGDRYVTFQGAGSGMFTGNFSNAASNSGVAVEHFGSGTLTLAGTNNTNMSDIIVNGGGTLAIANGAAFSFNATSKGTSIAPHVYLSNNSTLDVSAVSGGFTLTQSLQGGGNVVGNLAMANATQVIPGGGVQLDSVNQYSPTSVSYAVGALHFQNGLDLSQGSQMVWHLGALSTSGPGTNFDQLTVGGPLTLGGSSSLSVDLSLLSAGQQPGGGDPFWSSSHTWTIISNANNPGSTNFASIVGGTVATGTFSVSVGPGTILGDVNGDHVVNGLDIAVVASHWLLTGATLGQGDANGDGTVNGLDIALIASHWLSTSGGTGGSILLTYTPSAGGGTAVPEPSSAALVVLGLFGVVAMRRRSAS